MDPNTETVEDFVLKDSIQTEIEDQLLYAIKPPSATEAPTRPHSFAEAVMSTRRGRSNRVDDGSDATLAGPVSLESLGPFKYTFKKKKVSKWAPFDLGTTDSASEEGSVAEAGPVSRAASPSSQIPGAASTFTSTSSFITRLPPHPAPTSPIPSLEQSNSATSFTTPDKVTRYIGAPHTPTDPDPTPTQARFDLAALSLRDLGGDAVNRASPDYTDSGVSDTESTRLRTEEAMASLTQSFGSNKATKAGGDDFDALEWDNDPAAPDQSPEPVAANPQPLAYTTVGSIVNPNTVPQFTAPNRVQREGSGRRSLLPMMQGRHHDSFFQHRAPPPPLNMQNSMQYTQQLAHTPSRFNLNQTPTPNPSRSSRPIRSLRQTSSLTEQEKSVLTKVQGPMAPHMFSGNRAGPQVRSAPSDKLFSTATDATYLVDEVELGRSNNLQGQASVQGLEKMQTLQRLAKFDNPMRNIAQSRLSEFSVSKSTGQTTTRNNAVLTIEALLRDKTATPTTTLAKAGTNASGHGELDRNYQFPPPGFTGPSKAQINPLFGAYSRSTAEPLRGPANRPGYPAPLTAGPPGQRQYQGAANKSNTVHTDNPWASDTRTSAFNSYADNNALTTSSWVDSHNMMPAQPFIAQSIVPPHNGGGCNSNLVDTLPVPVASKYYPRGIPTDMTGATTPLPYLTQRKMGQIPNDPEPQTMQEKKAKKMEELDNWFYDGQRRFATMSADDHIKDLEERKRACANKFGPIGPPAKKNLPATKKEPFTAEDMSRMTVADAAAPLLDAAFGTLLSYGTKIKAPDTAKVLSKFEPSPAWQIDDTDKGNTSFFGEDWGPPPKRAGRDPRYQSTFHNPQSTNWEK